MDEARTKAIDLLIRNVIRKQLRGTTASEYGSLVDDIAQDAWVRVLTYMKNHNGEIPEDGIIGNMAKLAFKDSQINFANTASNEIQIAPVSDADTDSIERDYLDWYTDTYGLTKPESSETLLDLYDLVSKSSDKDKEYRKRWLEFYIQASGVKNMGIPVELTKNYEGYTKSALADYMGLPGTASGKFKRVNDEMENLFADYVGQSIDELRNGRDG